MKNASTSAMPTITLTLPLGKRSATSIWSRSFEVSLSMEDQKQPAQIANLIGRRQLRRMSADIR